MKYSRFVYVITNINVIKCFTSRNSENSVNTFAISLSKKSAISLMIFTISQNRKQELQDITKVSQDLYHFKDLSLDLRDIANFSQELNAFKDVLSRKSKIFCLMIKVSSAQEQFELPDKIRKEYEQNCDEQEFCGSHFARCSQGVHSLGQEMLAPSPPNKLLPMRRRHKVSSSRQFRNA